MRVVMLNKDNLPRIDEHIALKDWGAKKYPDLLLADAYEVPQSYVVGQLAKGEVEIAVALDEELQVMGTITLFYNLYPKRKHKATISSMVVDPARYRKYVRSARPEASIGHVLTLTMLQAAYWTGVEEIQSQTSTKNYVVHKINRDLGATLSWTEARGMKLKDGTYVDTHTFSFDLAKCSIHFPKTF